MVRISYVILIVLLHLSTLYSQTLYQSVQDQALYLFLDELSSQHIIDVNTAIKPYTRNRIASWLQEAAMQHHALSPAQQSRISSYLKEFALENNQNKQGSIRLIQLDSSLSVHLIPPEFSWRDTLTRINARPIYGIRLFNNGKESFFHSYGGAEASAYIGSKWGIQASVRDNYQQKYILAAPNYMTQEMGGNYKINEGGRLGGDFSELRGSVSYSWNWGHIALAKEHIQWGTNYNGSNIFSGRTPSFAMVKLHINPTPWFEFDYFHGWLVSQVIDSSRTNPLPGGGSISAYYDKYIAANMFTVRPLKRLYISVGNSIIYDLQNPHPAYFFPFNFFKSIAHTYKYGLPTNDNAMMYLSISSRQIKHLHIFYSLFVDELSLTRFGDPQRHNFLSHKGGISLSGWPARNVTFIAETTYTTPMTYQHRESTTTFESNRFVLGHYLRDNSRDYYTAVRWIPFKNWQFTTSLSRAEKANLFLYRHNSVVPADQNPVLQDITWRSSTLQLKLEWFPIHNLRIFSEYLYSNVQGFDVDGKNGTYYLSLLSPAFMHGKNSTIITGFAFGFQ